MLLAYFMRNIRRKSVLAIIFGLSLLYFIVSFFDNKGNSIISYHRKEDTKLVVLKMNEIVWNAKNDNKTEIDRISCTNSVQGKRLITDNRGYTCGRKFLQPNGCCDINSLQAFRYSCDTCYEDGCCSIYEYCVSCCSHPDKKGTLEKVLNSVESGRQRVLYTVNTQFELCLAVCRTNSASVFHENSYKNPVAKFCYSY